MAVRAAKAKGKRPKKSKGPLTNITLSNPVSQHFAAFIFGNALTWEALAHAELSRVKPDVAKSLEPFMGILGFWEQKMALDDMPEDHPDRPALHEHVSEQYAKWVQFRYAVDEHCDERYVVEGNSCEGQTLVLCGAGPTLREHAAEYIPKGDQVWGCNSAATWLIEQGHRVTHAFAVDQTAHMLVEWDSAPDVEYLLASTVHPHLTEYLLEKGRRIRYFMNYVGLNAGTMVSWGDEEMGYEDWMYQILYPGTVRVGSGLNSVNRAIDVALFAGFEKVYVLGADCCLKVSSPPPNVPMGSPEYRHWLESETVMHADGGNALASDATPMTLSGEIDGRLWVSKPDMLISAVWLHKFREHHKGRLELVGDTLPNALHGKSDEFLKRMPTMVTHDGHELPIGVI